MTALPQPARLSGPLLRGSNNDLREVGWSLWCPRPSRESCARTLSMTSVSKFDQRKEAIVRAATEIMNHRGVRGMTLPLVAAELGLVPRAVSYYFRRKEDSAAACYRLSIERMDGHITEALKEKSPKDACPRIASGSSSKASFSSRRERPSRSRGSRKCAP